MRRSNHSARPAPRLVEPLEGRTLMSASVAFDAARFTLRVTGDGASDVIVVNANGPFGQAAVVVNGAPVYNGGPRVKRVVVSGNGGNDVITVNLAVPATIHGGAGDDTIFGSPGADSVSGGDGDDRILGRGGDDVLSGGDGDDEVVGGGGKDRMFGGRGNDFLDAKDGVGGETVNGGFGRDSARFDKKVLFLFGGDDVSEIEFKP